MCINLKNRTKPVRVLAARKAYKVFEVNHKCDNNLHSPFKPFETKLGKLNETQYTSDYFMQALDINTRHTRFQSQNTLGFHLFIKKDDAIELAKWNNRYFTGTTVVAECTIPKGSALITGTDDDDKDTIMSNKYIATKIIHEEL